MEQTINDNMDELSMKVTDFMKSHHGKDLEMHRQNRELTQDIVTDYTCVLIEKIFQDTVDCECSIKYFDLRINFSCSAKEVLHVGGVISGKPEYSGVVKVNPFALLFKVGAGICFKGASVAGMSLNGDLCVSGNLCSAMDKAGFCGCSATVGFVECDCEPCDDDDNGVRVSCPNLKDSAFALPKLCLPLPYITKNTIPSLARMQMNATRDGN